MKFKDDVLVLFGAALGGLLGYFAFFWVVQQGFYGMVLPGGLLGFGAGVFKTRTKAVPVICGIAALLLGFFTEWQFVAPFRKDGSLSYFVFHLHRLSAITLIMIAVGTIIGFWIPFRRSQDANHDYASRS